MRLGASLNPSTLGVKARRWVRRAGRVLLLAGAALSVWSASAVAQTTLRNRGPAPPIPDDGLGPRDLLLQADQVVRDDTTSTVTAAGHVEARYQGKVLRADKITYNSVTGATHAVGNAVIVNPDGTTEYGEDVVLDDQFRAALALGFATRQTGNVTIAAGAAVRRNDVVNQLNQAVYTSCNICADNGAPKSPTWSISASRIVQDRTHQVIYYRNAVIRVLGIPIFYAPVFWHPDPSAPRRSGFLTPRFELSNRRGFSYQQPYLQTLGPSTDLIVSPQINTKVNPMLNLRYTERFYSGEIDLRGGYTYEYDFDNHIKFGNDTSRSWFLGRGLFDVTPDKSWVWGFGVERVTDPTLFERYNITQVYQDRGPFPADTDRLITQLYTVRSNDTSYLSAAALDFESLRAYSVDPTTGQGIYESSRAFPIVGPLLEARYDPAQPVLGGQLQVTASAVNLSRNGNRVISIYDPTGVTPEGPQLLSDVSLPALSQLPQAKEISALTYTDSRRASLGGDWRTTFTLNSGIQIEPFVQGRGDFYSIDDPQLLNVATGATTAGKSTVERIYGVAGANLSWPFIKPIGSASLVLEPLAQIALSPVYRVNPNIPNEDSVSFEYDETNLFSVDRFSGFDLVEGGQRLNVGGRGTLDWGTGQSATVLVGRTFRAEPDPQFAQTSGLANDDSDWIVAASTQPLPGMNLFTRARLDATSFDLRREETGISYGTARYSVSVRYDYNQSGISQTETGQTVIGKTEDVSVAGQAFVTRHWGFSANVSRDLADDVFPIAQVGLIYDDECIRVDVLYTHSEVYGNVIGTSNGVTFRISLSTLGGAVQAAPTNSRGSR
jgi:LPS-assembly protein